MNLGDSRAEFYISLQDRMKSDRGTWEILWTEIAERISTKDDDFLKTWQPGAARTYHVFDSTAALALPKFAAAMEQMLTPRTQIWHNLVPMNDDLADDYATKAWLARLNKLLFKVRYAPGTNFAAQMNEVYRGLGAFGTGALFINEEVGKGLRYKSIFLGELFFLENYVGGVDHVHRKYAMTARQACQQFGDDNLPPIICDRAKDFPEQQFDFLHVVCPNEEMQYGKVGPAGMQFKSLHIAYEGKTVVATRGYHTMPYAVSRYVTNSKEIYGRSPAIDALPDIKMANAQLETILRAGQLAVDPPMLLSDENQLFPWNSRPGSNNYGFVNADGKLLAQPLSTGANLQVGAELIDGTRRVINDAFLVTLFQILVEEPREMTATEVMQRAQEKGALIAPTAGRQQSELLGKIIHREIDMLSRNGMLSAPNFPPMPEQLRKLGGEYDVVYQSPLARAQRAEQAVGLSNLIGILTPIVEGKPEVLDWLDFDTIVPDMATDINGLPATWVTDPKVVAAIRAKRDQQMQMSQLAQAAPAATAAAANIAKIQQTAGAGSGVLPNLSAMGAQPQ